MSRQQRVPTTKNSTLQIGGPLLSIKDCHFGEDIIKSATVTVSEVQISQTRRLSRKVRVRAIQYRSNGNRVHGFLVEPKQLTEKTSCIIWNRGGSNDFGALTEWQVFAVLGMFASWGYIVIASQYAGNVGGEGTDEFGGSDVNDVLVLRDVLRRHSHADLSRIGMHGGSRGGMMTYLCLTKVDWIRAAVTNAGLANLERVATMRPEMNRLFKKMFGGAKKELLSRSAVLHASKFSKKTALLMMHGTNDWRVSPLDSIDLSAALLRAGVHHQLALFAGDDHNLTTNRKKRWQLTREWFDTHLTNKEKIRLTKGL